jgi:hypothetical protein
MPSGVANGLDLDWPHGGHYEDRNLGNSRLEVSTIGRVDGHISDAIDVLYDKKMELTTNKSVFCRVNTFSDI